VKELKTRTALVDISFYADFISRQLRYWESPSGIAYLGCHMYQGHPAHRVTYVFVLPDFVSSPDALDELDIRADLRSFLGQPEEFLIRTFQPGVSRRKRKKQQRNNGNNVPVHVFFSDTLKDLGFEKDEYPDLVDVFQIKSGDDDIVLLLPNHNAQSAKWVLARVDLERDERAIRAEVRVFSQNKYFSDSNSVICLMPAEMPVMISQKTCATYTAAGIVTEELTVQ